VGLDDRAVQAFGATAGEELDLLVGASVGCDADRVPGEGGRHCASIGGTGFVGVSAVLRFRTHPAVHGVSTLMVDV
jgi:hypothetical protein